MDWVRWGAGTLESGRGRELLQGQGRAGAGTAQGRSGYLWGFWGRGTGQARGFASPHLPQRLLLLQRRKWKPAVLPSPANPPPRPVSEVAELQKPVPESLT